MVKKFIEGLFTQHPDDVKFHFSDNKGLMTTPELQFRYEGLCDFNGMYAALVDYCKHHGYIWQETSYKHKVPSPKGAEQEYRWKISKDVNEIVQYHVTIEAHAWDMKDVVVDVDGVKQNFTNLRLEIKFFPSIQFDRRQYFASTTGILGVLSKLYWKSMSWQYLITYHDDLYYGVLNLQNILKQYCDMKSNKTVY